MSIAVETTDFSLATKRVLLSILGLAICSKVAVPFYPVPITLQTFATYMIALFLSPKEACLTLAGYLSLGIAGFPVFTTIFGGPTTGYLVGMLVGAPLASAVVQRKLNSVFSCLVCYLSVHLLGWLWLSKFVGWGAGFYLGIVPFIIPDVFKISIACGIKAKFCKKVVEFKNDL